MQADGNTHRASQSLFVFAIRVLLIGTLVLITILGFMWRGLLADLNQGRKLCEEGRYEEGESVLTPLLYKPLSAIRIREEALELLRKCRIRRATDQLAGTRKVEEYEGALELLIDTRETFGSSKALERHIKNCAQALEKLQTKPPPPRIILDDQTTDDTPIER